MRSPASSSSCVAIRCWPTGATAHARRCCRPPGQKLATIAEPTTRVRNRFKRTEAIASRVGRVVDYFKMVKHFELTR
jgi:hypothetical protein